MLSHYALGEQAIGGDEVLRLNIDHDTLSVSLENVVFDYVLGPSIDITSTTITLTPQTFAFSYGGGANVSVDYLPISVSLGRVEFSVALNAMRTRARTITAGVGVRSQVSTTFRPRVSIQSGIRSG